MQLRPRQKTFVDRASAKAAGATHYETNKPCKHGHFARRFASNGMCQDCTSAYNAKMVADGVQKERARKFRVLNPGNGAAAQRRFWAAHSEAITAKRNAKHKSTPDYFAAIARRYRERNQDKHRAYMRDYYKRNPAPFLASASNRRARLLMASVAWANPKDILAVYRQCAALTKLTGVLHHVDHEIPLGGKEVCGLHVANNLTILTATENRSKGNRWISDHAA